MKHRLQVFTAVIETTGSSLVIGQRNATTELPCFGTMLNAIDVISRTEE